jgi:hypothetical protein
VDEVGTLGVEQLGQRPVARRDAALAAEGRHPVAVVVGDRDHLGLVGVRADGVHVEPGDVAGAQDGDADTSRHDGTPSRCRLARSYPETFCLGQSNSTGTPAGRAVDDPRVIP